MELLSKRCFVTSTPNVAAPALAEAFFGGHGTGLAKVRGWPHAGFTSADGGGVSVKWRCVTAAIALLLRIMPTPSMQRAPRRASSRQLDSTPRCRSQGLA